MVEWVKMEGGRLARRGTADASRRNEIKEAFL